MGKLGFYYDARACSGCRACQVACKDKNQLEVGVLFRRVRTFEVGKYPDARYFHFSSACNHCEEAKCVAGCPTGAMHYAADGTVQLDKDKCIGCRYCMMNCPYGAIQFLEDVGIVGKCDSCIDLRDAGQNPVCVDACTMRVLKFGDLDELAAEYGPELVSEIPILAPAEITKPALLIKPKTIAFNPNFKELEV